MGGKEGRVYMHKHIDPMGVSTRTQIAMAIRRRLEYVITLADWVRQHRAGSHPRLRSSESYIRVNVLRRTTELYKRATLDVARPYNLRHSLFHLRRINTRVNNDDDNGGGAALHSHAPQIKL